MADFSTGFQAKYFECCEVLNELNVKLGLWNYLFVRSGLEQIKLT